MKTIIAIIILFSVVIAGEYVDACFGDLTVSETIRFPNITIIDSNYTVTAKDIVIRFIGDTTEANAVVTLPDAITNPGRVLFFSNGTELHTHTGGVVFETASIDQNALYPIQTIFCDTYNADIQEEACPFYDLLMTWSDQVFAIFPHRRNSSPTTLRWIETVSSTSFVNHAFVRGNSRSSSSHAGNLRLFPLTDHDKLLFFHHDYAAPGPTDTIITMSIQTLPYVHTSNISQIGGWTSLSNPRFSQLDRSWGMYGGPDSLTMYTVDSIGVLWLSTIQTDSLVEKGAPWKAYRQILTNVVRFTVNSTNWGEPQYIAFQTFDSDSIYLYNTLEDTLIFVDTVSVSAYPQVITEYIDGCCKVSVLYHDDEGRTCMRAAYSYDGYPLSLDFRIDGLIHPFMDPGWPACEWKMLTVATAIDTASGCLRVSFPCNADDAMAFGGWDRAVEVPFDVYQGAPVIARRCLSSEAVIAWYNSDGKGPYVGKIWFLDIGESCALISDGTQWSVLYR